jgi:hypothetical protein
VTAMSSLLALVLTLAACEADARAASGDGAAAGPFAPLVPPAQHLGGGDRSELALSLDWAEEGRVPERRFRRPPWNGSLGFRAAPVWLRLRVVYDGEAPAQKILLLGFMPDVATLFRREGDRLIPMASSGIDRRIDERSVQDTRVAFRIAFQPHEDATFWLEVRSDEVVWARASLVSEATYARSAALLNLALGLYYGVLLALILYNGVIYLSTRERTYLLYTDRKSVV